MQDMSRLVMCVPADHAYDTLSDAYACWLPKAAAETNENFRQVIPYCAVQRPDKKILTYERAGGEGRLHGLLSIGVGGHIENGESFHEGMVRELWEECGDTGRIAVERLGLISFDETPVDRVHLGVGFLVSCEKATPGEELKNPSWKTVAELDRIHDRLEPWSQKLLYYIKNPF